MEVRKSCVTCPSFLKADQTISKFGRSIGSPMCGRYGHVLDKPGVSAAQTRFIQQTFAEKCDAHGNPLPSEPLTRSQQVMLPDPELRDLSKIDQVAKDACTTCAMCKNYVAETIVATELGWTAGLCAAKGRLLMSNRLSYEARTCEFRQVGMTRPAIGGLHFMPEYELEDPRPANAYFKAKAEGFKEPSEYPTDREVTEEDLTAGIKSWRKYEDPEGTGNAVYFPVYDPSYFDDDERALIPKTGSDEHPELYVDHFGGMYQLGVAWLELDETPVFWGIAGVGKTELLRHAAWIMQLPFHRISITASSEIDEIAGKYEYDPEKGTWFRMGRVPEAWSKPGILCLDEPNVAKDPAVWHFLRPLTDNSKQLVLDMYDSRPIDRHPDCYLGLAMNPAWDARNVGALEIADADANRLFHTEINLPPKELEKEIIQARVKLDGWELSDEQLRSLIATAEDIRKLTDEGELPISWAIRPQIKVARALRWFTPIMAYRKAVADYLEPEAREVLLDQVRQNWKEA